MFRVFLGSLSLALVLIVATQPAAQPSLKPGDAPLFQIRARVVSQQGQAPTGKKFTFRVSTAKAVTTQGDEWSDWLTFGEEQRAATLKGYPALYLRGYPVITGLSVTGVVDPTEVEAELKFAEGGRSDETVGRTFWPDAGFGDLA